MREMTTMVRAAAVAALGIALTAASAAAQQGQADVHANYQRGTATHVNGWGVGANVQETFGASSAPVRLSVSVGPDYIKQENSGPSAVSASLDATLQPGGGGALTPYAGGSVSSNWSLGDNRQFEGARLGTEAVGGVQVKLDALGSLTTKVEERFGYVNGQEHTLTTRLGFAMSF
jgi:hypothetical protein